MKTCSKCGEEKDRRNFPPTGGRCRLCLAAYAAAWRAANPEQAKASRVAAAAAYLPTKRRRAAKYRANNRERLRLEKATYYAAYPERKKAVDAAWAAAHPDQRRAFRQTRRARKAAAPFVESVYRSKVWTRDGGICYLCGLPADPAAWHMDHVVPLSRDGEHSYANVAVTHPRCNLSKGDKLLSEMAAAA